MRAHTPLFNYYCSPLQHIYPWYFQRLISLMASQFYLLSHALFKSNIPFQEFSLLSCRWCSELCPLGLSTERALGEKMLEFLDLRMSLGSFHKWMTVWLDTAVGVVPWSLENTQNVNPVIFCNWLEWGIYLFKPFPLLGKLFPKKFKCFDGFHLLALTRKKSKLLKTFQACFFL